MDVTLGHALELALSAGVIGEELGGNPALNTRLREAVNFEKVVPTGEAPSETGGADCRVICGTNDAGLGPGLTPRGASAPATTPARHQARKLPRLELMVIRGGLAALPMQRRKGVPRTRAAGLRLVTINGVCVDHSAASR